MPLHKYRKSYDRGTDKKPVDGRSIRYRQWRYTEWDKGEEGTELYDYDIDPHEFENLAHKEEYGEIRKQLQKLLHQRK